MLPSLTYGMVSSQSLKSISIWEMPPSGLEVRSIKHAGSIRDNIKRYTDLVLQVPDMSERDLLFNFISNLSPWAK